MEIFFKFSKASFFLGGKVLVTSESDSDNSEVSMDQPKEAASVNGTVESGVLNEAKLAKAAVAAASAPVEHSTIMIPALQHRRNLSAFNWTRGQGYDKSLNKLTAFSTHDFQQKNGTTNWETSLGLGEEIDGDGPYQLRRTGKALDLKSMLEDHDVQFPICSYEEFEDEFEEYDSSKLETIWEEEEDEHLAKFL